MPCGQDARAFFPPLARARIENLACSAPGESGLQVTHWSARTLEQIVVEHEIVTTIHYTSIALLLRQADLQPHRYRYWKTTIWDEEAIERTAKILWCYERAEWLWNKGEIVVCLDEKPALQILRRLQPKQLMTPGAIERHEFEYERQGTVNLLTGLTVATGQMWAECLERNDGAHFRPATERYLATLKEANKVHLIIDNGPSHTSADTLDFFKTLNPRTRVLFTPPHASWLNQGELLLRAFSARYLQRGDWSSRAQFLKQFPASVQEYNDRFAHPFQWSWTRRNFHDWLDWRELISCKT
jgi:hypothetical protein